MNAFDLHDEYVRYQREGGWCSFTMWAGRYGDDYGCDGAWLAEDYLSAWRHHEDREPDVPMQSFREWLASQPREYLEAHLDEVPEIPIQGRGVDLDRTEGEVGPIVAAADAGTGGHHADSRAAAFPTMDPWAMTTAVRRASWSPPVKVSGRAILPAPPTGMTPGGWCTPTCCDPCSIALARARTRGCCTSS